MPLAVGNTWTYRVRVIGPEPYCTESVTQQVVTAEPRGDHTGFVVTWFCGTTELSSTWLGDVDGDLKEDSFDGDDLTTRLASPLRDGARG